MEAKEKQFEKRMFLIMRITCVLAVAIIFLLPNGSGLTAMEKIKESIIVVPDKIFINLDDYTNDFRDWVSDVSFDSKIKKGTLL